MMLFKKEFIMAMLNAIIFVLSDNVKANRKYKKLNSKTYYDQMNTLTVNLICLYLQNVIAYHS